MKEFPRSASVLLPNRLKNLGEYFEYLAELYTVCPIQVIIGMSGEWNYMCLFHMYYYELRHYFVYY